MVKAKDPATVEDAEVVEVEVDPVDLEAAEAEAVDELVDEQAQAEADFQAQAEAIAKANTPEATDRRIGVDEDLDWDFITNDAGQVVSPEVLEIQDRQKQELADRIKAADEKRRVQDQGPRTKANHPDLDE